MALDNHIVLLEIGMVEVLWHLLEKALLASYYARVLLRWCRGYFQLKKNKMAKVWDIPSSNLTRRLFLQIHRSSFRLIALTKLKLVYLCWSLLTQSTHSFQNAITISTGLPCLIFPKWLQRYSNLHLSRQHLRKTIAEILGNTALFCLGRIWLWV